MLAEAEHRQHWVYFGGGISGGTWAYKRESGLPDRLSYREWRLVLGWESKPPQAPGAFGSAGTRFNAEVGWALGRDFEFDSGAPDISLGSGLLLRAGCSF